MKVHKIIFMFSIIVGVVNVLLSISMFLHFYIKKETKRRHGISQLILILNQSKVYFGSLHFMINKKTWIGLSDYPKPKK